MKISVLESLFNKAAGQKACHFIKKKPQHRCFPVKYAKSLRNFFYHRTPPVGASGIFSRCFLLDQMPLKV